MFMSFKAGSVCLEGTDLAANFQECCQSLCVTYQKIGLKLPYSDFDDVYKYLTTHISKHPLWVNSKSLLFYHP